MGQAKAFKMAAIQDRLKLKLEFQLDKLISKYTISFVYFFLKENIQKQSKLYYSVYVTVVERYDKTEGIETS